MWYSTYMTEILGIPIEDLLSEALLKERNEAIERDGTSEKWDADHYEGLAAVAGLRKQ